jgi:hypothetical protein
LFAPLAIIGVFLAILTFFAISEHQIIFDEKKLIYRRLFWKKEVPYEKMAWAYLLVRKQYIIPIPFPYHHYKVIVCDTNSLEHELRGGNKKNCERIIEELVKRNNGRMFVGYNEALHNLWLDKKPQFYQELEKRIER